MNDKNNLWDSDDEQPILTPEEIELIKQRRRQNEKKQSSSEFFTDFSKPQTEEKKKFQVNIPTKDLIDSYESEYYYDKNRSKSRNANDISFNKNNNTRRERYDHERYLAEQEEYFPQEDESKTKRKKGGCSSKLLSLLLIVAILIGSCYAYLFYLSSQVTHADLEDNYSDGLLSDSGVKNILLIGLDKEDGGTSRSDTMMLLSIDTENETLKLTSFLRDMWVAIPNNGSAKLNASYAYGGPQLTVDTIETNFEIDIDHFVLVDFEMFEKIIDSLGGVTVDITEYEAEFLRNNTRVKVPAGENTLSGEYALIYARIRKLDSDFQRTQRQRKVISAIIEKAKQTNPIKLAGMLSDIMPLIETDIKATEMTQMAFSALKYIQYDIDQLQVPADNAYTNQMIYGQSALVPDMEINKENIKNFIY